VHGRLSALIAVAAVCSLAARPVAAQVDTFETNQATLTAPPGGASNAPSLSSDVLGMNRGLMVALRSGVGPVTAQVSGGAFSFSVATTMPASRGEALLSWDGDTDPLVLSPTGLGGYNLAAAGPALRMSVASATAGVELTFTVYTDATNASVLGMVLPAIAAPIDVEVPFASFVASAGAGANFASVGAVTLAVRGNGGSVSLGQIVLGPSNPTFTALLTDGVTSARPGDTLNYSLALRNNGPGAANGVIITDQVDPDTTLVPTSVEVSPLAIDDQYAGATVGTPFSVVAPGVLMNDVDGDGDSLLVAPVGMRPTAQGGTATVNGDGSFSYMPPASFRGLDTFDYQADDGNGIPGPGVVTVHVDCPVVSVTPTTLDDGVTGTPYGPVQFMATGTTGTVTWSVTGALPTGLNFSAAGVLDGTPSQSGTFPLTFVATDSLGCAGSQAITLTVNGPPEITSPDNTSFTVGVEGTFTLTATGFPDPTITHTGGTLPSAVVYTEATKTLSGIPGVGTVGAHLLQFTASNGINPDDVQDFTLNVVCPTITVNGPALPDGLFNAAYAGATFTQMGSTGTTITWSATGLLGLVIHPTTGAVSGSPTNTAVNGPVTITATDEFGCQGTANRTLTVRPNPDAETYNGGVGNTQYVVGAAAPGTPHVFVGDNVKNGDQGPGPLSVSFPPTSTGGAILEGAVDGTFTYTPSVGFASNDSFTYTLTDGNGVTNTATVTINQSTLVWYVNSAGANGDGRSHNPFNRLDNAGGPSAPTSTIFVHTGGATTLGNLTMDANQTLWGQGAEFTRNNLTILAGVAPTLTGTVTLASNGLVNSVSFSGAAPALTAGAGVTAPVTINQVSTSGGTSALSLTNVSGAVTVTGGTFSNGSNAEVLISQGTGNVSIGAVITNNSGRSIDIQNRTSGTVTFSGAITDTGTGIILNSNGAPALSSFTFSGGMTLNGASSTFTATNSGTLTITGTNTIGMPTPPTITALNIANTTIGAGGLTFQRVSAGTGAGTAGNGIILDNTGSTAGLTVTGTGAAGSGGTIQRKTGANGSATQGVGIYLNRTRNASFSRMQLQDFDNFAIRANEIDGLTLSDVVVAGLNGNSAGDDEGSILLEDAGGTVAISNGNVSGGYEDNLRVLYDNASAGPAAVFNVTGTTFRDLQAAGQNSQVNLRSATTASSSWNVAFNFTSACVFENDANTLPPGGTENWSDGILVTFEGPFQHSLTSRTRRSTICSKGWTSPAISPPT
jgi:uncharacterized repeat protein (TIGR01451 family)